MSAEDGGSEAMDSAIARVYGGPLDLFVERRDALAKELRSAGRRDDATVVKALRKPSRTAWALDAAAAEPSGAMGSLADAIAATLQAQAGGGDVRQAIGELRRAVRQFAAHAARTAGRAGQAIEESTLANAILAVIGRPDALDALRRGCLVGVPDAGGLDFLSDLPLAPAPTPAAPVARPAKEARARTDEAGEKAAREAVRRAGIELASARERSAEAQRALDEVESKLDGAEERLRQAEREVRALRGERERARQAAEAAAAGLLEAENAAADAQRLVDRGLGAPPAE